jgi:hypothetical protein
VDTCENRLIKRALLFAEQIVGKMLDQGQRSAVMLQGLINAKFDGAHSPIDQVMLKVAPIEKLVGFYGISFPLPVQKSNCQI